MSQKSFQSKIPLIFTIIGALSAGSLWIYRILSLPMGSMFILSLATFLLYAGWLSWESRVSVREVDRERTDHDGKTLEFASFSKGCVIFGSLIPPFEPQLTVALIGLALALFGAVFRIWAIVTIGTSNYSQRIRPPKQQLASSGPYALVRHPAYLGTLLAHTGIVLVFLNTWSLAALLLLWYPAVIVRAFVEDRYLNSFPEYEEYCRNVRFKMIPLVF